MQRVKLNKNWYLLLASCFGQLLFLHILITDVYLILYNSYIQTAIAYIFFISNIFFHYIPVTTGGNWTGSVNPDRSTGFSTRWHSTSCVHIIFIIFIYLYFTKMERIEIILPPLASISHRCTVLDYSRCTNARRVERQYARANVVDECLSFRSATHELKIYNIMHFITND